MGKETEKIAGVLIMDFFIKIKILRIVLCDGISQAFEYWKSEIWEKDLDALDCCDGRECCCQGKTIREVWNIYEP